MLWKSFVYIILILEKSMAIEFMKFCPVVIDV